MVTMEPMGQAAAVKVMSATIYGICSTRRQTAERTGTANRRITVTRYSRLCFNASAKLLLAMMAPEMSIARGVTQLLMLAMGEAINCGTGIRSA